MTDPHSTSSIFAAFPRPFLTIGTRPLLLEICHQRGSRPFTILSPAYAGASLGLPWWLHLITDIEHPSILDCGANAALALEALHRGIDGVICRDFRATIPKAMEGRLASIRPSVMQHWQNTL